MIADKFSWSGDDFDVLCNMVSVFPVEYDVVTEVTDAEEEYFAEDLAEHMPICYYVMNNGCVEE